MGVPIISRSRADPTHAVHRWQAAVVAAAWCVALGLPLAADAQDGGDRRFDIGGLIFGDLYHVVHHHTEADEGATGLVVRRGYLTFDADFSERWFGRLRFELNQSGEYEAYDFEVDVKDLHAGWRVGDHTLRFGLAPTPTFDLIESIWGARYLVRTPMDLQGVASRDTGVSAQGSLGSSGSLGYRAMLGAGLEFGNESGDGRKWMGALTWTPSPGWTVDLYVDYERLSGPTDRMTGQLFVGYEAGTLRWGLQYSHQDREEDPKLELASAFVVGRVGERTSLIGRVDRLMEPSPSGDSIRYIPFDPTARATFFVAGVELRTTPRFRVTPNVIVIAYDTNDQGVRPATDVQIRLTVFLDLE
jgi:hypothetical protein